ncbi:hypothetical protein FJY94_00725 [Candidatus Kaiserbacteria bacterium]|nr:hypothetical protein [Candidatus Kaiserbacteria bacterium]
MQTLTHPRSGTAIEGVRLPPGSAIRGDDMYDSSDGTWRTADSAAGGKVPRGDHVIWVRQPGPLSDNARELLGYLNLRPWGEKTCIGERNGAFYVIPSPAFNWDGRLDIEAKRVAHAECVQELVDHGCLAFSEVEATNWMSDYATVWRGHKNCIYALTDEGMQKGKEILAQ